MSGAHLSAPLPVYCTTLRSVQVSISRTQWPSVVRGATTRKGLTWVMYCTHLKACQAGLVVLVRNRGTADEIERVVDTKQGLQDQSQNSTALVIHTLHTRKGLNWSHSAHSPGPITAAYIKTTLSLMSTKDTSRQWCNGAWRIPEVSSQTVQAHNTKGLTM